MKSYMFLLFSYPILSSAPVKCCYRTRVEILYTTAESTMWSLRNGKADRQQVSLFLSETLISTCFSFALLAACFYLPSCPSFSHHSFSPSLSSCILPFLDPFSFSNLFPLVLESLLSLPPPPSATHTHTLISMFHKLKKPY